MLRVVIAFLIVFCLNVSPIFAKHSKEEVKSTQGVEVDNSILKTVKPSPKQRKEQKEKQKTSSNYLKKKKQIIKQDAILKKKQKELEFLQDRLEVKKSRLDGLSLQGSEKGEKK